MAKGYRNTLFTRVKTPKPPVNKFDLSHDKMLTAQMGKLYPVLCQEMVPGDRFRVQSDMMCRTMPLVSPAFGSLKAYIHYFFVPNRLLWNGWEDFIAGGEDGENTFVPPYVTYSDFIRDIHNFYGVSSNIGLGLLGDYFCLPISDSFETSNLTPVSLLPFRAYALIWNEYYRDQNVDNEIDIEFEVGGRIPLGSSSSSVYTFNYHRLLRSRRWLKDYFTSALPWQQRGTAPALPISGFTNAEFKWLEDGSQGVGQLGLLGLDELSLGERVTSADDLNRVRGDPASVGGHAMSTVLNDLAASADPRYLCLRVGNASQDLLSDNNVVDLSSATTFNVADLRLVFQIQKWLERNARAGARYIEFLGAHFGVHPRDERLQRPEYVGGSKSSVIVSEVLQTSSSDATSPQGNQAGHTIS